MSTIEHTGDIPKVRVNPKRVVHVFRRALDTVVQRVTPQQRVPYDQNPAVWPRNIQHRDRMLAGLNEYADAYAQKKAVQTSAIEATVPSAASGILLEELSELGAPAQQQPIAAPDDPRHRGDGAPKVIGWPTGGAHK